MSPRPASAKSRSRRPAAPKAATRSTAKSSSGPAAAIAMAIAAAPHKPSAKPRAGAAPAVAQPATRSRTTSRTAIATVDRKKEPISQFTLANIRPDTLIAPNFLIHELTRSELADRRGIANVFPSDRELRAAIHLAREVLQPIRDHFGRFTPNSVFRGHPLERALKNKPASWLSTSQHARGEACDIEIVGMSTLALANWAKDHLEAFDQIICECYDPAKGPNSGWVHISLKAPGGGENRRQLLSYIADHGRMVYVPGLRATTLA